MALEAINHAGHLPNTPFLVVLNDNDMSISPPVGALSNVLNRARLSPPMQFLSGSVEESVRHLPFMGGELPAELNRLKGSMRRLAVPKVGAVFEELGFTYMGPIDGHDIGEMVRTFQAAHREGGPVLVHVVTKKGKGYPYAEADQVGYHAQSAFDLNTGKAIPSSKPGRPVTARCLARPSSSSVSRTVGLWASRRPWPPAQDSTCFKRPSRAIHRRRHCGATCRHTCSGHGL